MGYPLSGFLWQEVFFKWVLWPIFFNIFVSTLEEGTEGMVFRFADDTKLEGVVTIPLTDT